MSLFQQTPNSASDQSDNTTHEEVPERVSNPEHIEELVRVPDAEYIVRYVTHYRRNYKGITPKLVFEYEIIDPPQYQGKIVCNYYNVKFTRQGRIKSGPKSDYARDLYRICPDANFRLDQLPIYPFKQDSLRVRTCTVVYDPKKNPLPEPSKYSRIDSVFGIAQRSSYCSAVSETDSLDSFDEDIPF